jgi:hypothetical protein
LSSLSWTFPALSITFLVFPVFDFPLL